jgi:hypothetical protein
MTFWRNGMARRIVNRKEKRAEYEAFEERTKSEDEEVEEEEGDDEEEGDEEEDAEPTDAAADGEAGDAEGDGEDEEAPKKKKKKKEPKPKVVKAKAKSRARTPKIVRMKVVWGVFNNSNQRVATYDYPQKKQADEHAAKLIADKRSTHFVQPVKEPFEVKKEE